MWLVGVDVASFPSRLWQSGMTGSRTMDGRLEVYYQQQWRTVCDEMFGDEEARVICSTISLGLLRYVTTTFHAHAFIANVAYRHYATGYFYLRHFWLELEPTGVCVCV